MVDEGVLPESKEHQLPGSRVKGQKNISYRNIEISIFTLKQGPIAGDGVLPGSKEHRLPGSKVKKTLIRKVDKTSRNHASRSI
jgi:hypothetical protein